jgi:glutamate-1-semialdehyde aminotransferase
MTHVFHRYPRTELPVAVSGQGIHITDSTGKRYLDASGGAAVSCLGHGHPRVIAAIRRQAEALEYAHTALSHEVVLGRGSGVASRDAADLVRPSPLPARCDTARRLALPALYAELPGR